MSYFDVTIFVEAKVRIEADNYHLAVIRANEHKDWLISQDSERRVIVDSVTAVDE